MASNPSKGNIPESKDKHLSILEKEAINEAYGQEKIARHDSLKKMSLYDKNLYIESPKNLKTIGELVPDNLFSAESFKPSDESNMAMNLTYDNKKINENINKPEGKHDLVTVSKSDKYNDTYADVNQETLKDAELVELKQHAIKLVERDGVKDKIKIKRSDKYYIIRTIGEGNFAKVKLAKHVITSKFVAIKVVTLAKLSEELKKKLSREISVMKEINHPNIVRLLEVMEKREFTYLIMEYAGGGELYDYLAHYGYLKERDAKLKFQQMLSAVEYCHKMNIVHRDLKADNVLLDSKMDIKIADFGFATYFKPGKSLTTFCGSPLYAAPELLMGKRYLGPPVDVWSLGVILFSIVSGRLPFDGDTYRELKIKVLNLRYDFPYFLSNECVNLIRSILIINPNDRASIEKIKQDKWMQGVVYTQVPKQVENEQLDLTRIERICKEGYEYAEIEESVRNKRFNHAYASYILLDKTILGSLPSTTSLQAAGNLTISNPKSSSPVGYITISQAQNSKAKETPNGGSKFQVAPAVNEVPKQQTNKTETVKFDINSISDAPANNQFSITSMKGNILGKTLKKMKPVTKKDDMTDTQLEEIQKIQMSLPNDPNISIQRLQNQTQFLEALNTTSQPSNSTNKAGMFKQQTIAHQQTKSPKKNSKNHPKPQNTPQPPPPPPTAELLSRRRSKMEEENNPANPQTDITSKIKGFFSYYLYGDKDKNVDPDSASIAAGSRGVRRDDVGESVREDVSLSKPGRRHSVNSQSNVKPRLDRFTVSMKTVSGKPPDEMMAEVKRVLDQRQIRYEQPEKYLLVCCDGNIQWELELCRLGVMNLHGIRMKRIFGSSFGYAKLISAIMKDWKF